VHTELLPRPVQDPRPPIWVAGERPHRRPLDRAIRWDGFVPLSADGPLTPDQVADYLDGVERPPAWEVVAVHPAGIPGHEYVQAGVTWLVEGIFPEGNWIDDLRASIRRGPRN
jgi:hypothetical protein